MDGLYIRYIISPFSDIYIYCSDIQRTIICNVELVRTFVEIHGQKLLIADYVCVPVVLQLTTILFSEIIIITTERVIIYSFVYKSQP